ncbi:MAG TPA: ester cyclase [Puia sp.]|nr:ester cyclase [Puia sp.]
MNHSADKNKQIVTRFNKEVMEEGNKASFMELVAADCVNHAAAPGAPAGKEGMGHFLLQVLRTAFPDLKITIHEQVAENDLVTTRKSIHATHTGESLGVLPTHKKVVIEVIDIIRLKNGLYAEHWGISNIPSVIAELSA